MVSMLYDVYLYIHINIVLRCFFSSASTCFIMLFEIAGQPQPSGVPSGYISFSGTLSQEWKTTCLTIALLLLVSRPLKKYFTWMPHALYARP